MPASLRIAAAVAYCTFLVASDAAGQTFDLSVPGTTTRSVAVLSVDRLRITGDDGTTFTYLREPRYDVAGYLGFYDDVSRQAVRWPTGGADRFEIGSVGLRGITFRTSQMVIVPRAAPLPPTPRPPLPGPPTPRRAPAPASGEVELTVANRTGAGLAIYYVDRSTGRRTKYFDIASSASERQPSYVGHVWQAVDARGSVVEEYRVPDFATVTWEIGGAAPALFDPAAIYTLESALGRDALLSARPLNGANAEVGGAADTRSVRLKLRPTDSGYFEIASADSPDLVLDLPGAAETEGTNVRLWDRRDGSAAETTEHGRERDGSRRHQSLCAVTHSTNSILFVALDYRNRFVDLRRRSPGAGAHQP